MSPGSIQLFDEGLDFNYPRPDSLFLWINNTLKSEHKLLSYLNIIFCSDEYLLALNQDYLKHDYFTDIITFQYCQEPIEGELYISLDRVKENAQELELSWMSELHRVIIHGVLHLIGYGDKTKEESASIRKKEDYYLNSFKKL